jgi:hypothetical protein
MSNRYTCPYCDFTSNQQGALTYHMKACIFDPVTMEKVREVITQPDQTIIRFAEYVKLSGKLGIPSGFTLRNIFGSWSEVAIAFGLTGGKHPAIAPRTAADITDAFVEEERDRLYTRTMDFPLKGLPPRVKRSWCPMRHTYYQALVMELR